MHIIQPFNIVTIDVIAQILLLFVLSFYSYYCYVAVVVLMVVAPRFLLKFDCVILLLLRGLTLLLS